MAKIPWLADVLRAAGVEVVEEGNWRDRAVSGPFNPIGVLWHHTASVTSSPGIPHPALSVVINGRSDLRGPLAQALVDYNGVNQRMSAAQYTASLKATAAVLRQLGRDESYVRGHRETSVRGQVDPYAVNLDLMRADVAALMDLPEAG